VPHPAIPCHTGGGGAVAGSVANHRGTFLLPYLAIPFCIKVVEINKKYYNMPIVYKGKRCGRYGTKLLF